MSVLGVFLARLKGLILVKFHFERLHSASFSSPEISTEVSVLLAFALACRCCLSMAAWQRGSAEHARTLWAAPQGPSRHSQA